MYLGHRKVRGKGYKTGFISFESKIPAEALKELVVRLRRGDGSVKDRIILGHMGLVAQLVGRYVNYFPKKTDDMLGVAFLALTEAVNSFQLSAKNDLITPYIVTCVHGKLSNYIKEDRVVRVTVAGVDKIVENARRTGEKIVVPDSEKLDSGDPKVLEEIKAKMSVYDDHSRLAINEIVDKLNLTRFETMIFNKLMDDWSLAEIAKDSSYTRQRVYQVHKELVAKLRPHFEDELDTLWKVVNNVFKTC